jgi:hypothetical protein
MGTRAELGADWSDIVARWYLGASPPIPANIGWAALGALERLWPEYLDDFMARGITGPAAIAPVIDLGMTLAACENLPGFAGVLGRIKCGERSAVSESYIAAALAKLGYRPQLEPELAGKRLDAVVSVDGASVYFEVTTPELSMDMQQAFTGMQHIADELRAERPGQDVMVYLLTEPTSNVAHALRGFVRQLPSSPIGAVHELADIALVRCMPFHPGGSPPFPAPNPLDHPILVVVGFEIGPDSGMRATVRLPLTDDRARWLMDREYRQFSPQEINVLVMDVSAIPSAVKQWVPIIVERYFQPSMNRRVGAAVLVDLPTVGPTVEHRWSVVPNPHAHRPVPDALLSDLAGLNEAEAPQGQAGP